MSPITATQTTASNQQPPILSDSMMARFAARAPEYDRDNRFFTEDFEELRQSRYLVQAVPRELGGGGCTLAEIARQQRRLGYYAAPTALGINMHLYWTGIAADLWRAGDHSLRWLLEEAAQGAIFAAGHGEAGNDIPVLLSTTRAEKVNGGYRFTGRKCFGSLSPMWTFLGIHGMDTSGPTPKVVHAFLPRNAQGFRIESNWDVMGMRATRSDDTILDGVVVPDKYIARVVPAGAAGLDPFVLGIFAWALLGFGNIYYALARRALDLTLESVKNKHVLALTRPMSYHAEVQHRVAEMGLAIDSIEPLLERVAMDWSEGVDHGATWPARILSAKYHAVENSWRVVDLAMELAGGYGIFRKSGMEQIFRDARLGRIHPGNSMLTHELVAKTLLGISPDETPRWG